MFALPCLVTKSGRATSSATVSSSPRGTGAGGDGGGGCFRPPAFGGWRGGGLVWGPQQTRRDTCRPLQAWSFVGQLCMCSKWALPARRQWGAHFMVSPLTAVAHSPLLECAPRARWQAMQWAQLQLRSACYVVISVMSQRTACFSCAPKSLAGRACVSRVLGTL